VQSDASGVRFHVFFVITTLKLFVFIFVHIVRETILLTVFSIAFFSKPWYLYFHRSEAVNGDTTATKEWIFSSPLFL